jgi:DNA-binding beta-propeller fold protein YncE
MTHNLERFRRHLLLIVTAALAACGGPALSIAHSPSPSQRGVGGGASVVAGHLWIAQGDPAQPSLALVDAQRGAVVTSYPGGVAANDWSRVYVVAMAGGHNLIKVLDGRTGQSLSVTPAEPGFALPEFGPAQRPSGVSPNGRYLVLQQIQEHPDPQESNTFLVYDTEQLGAAPQAVKLTGQFLYDGINEDASSLYLLEDSAAQPGVAYRVRRYDLHAHRLDPRVIVDKRSGEESISGDAIDRVTTVDGSWQFTVYALGDGAPMVHALNLADATAFCIDLPRAQDQSLDLLWGIAAARDGRSVYAVNMATGSVAAMPASRPWETRRATLPVPSPTTTEAWTPWAPVTVEAKRIAYGAAVVSRDGGTLYSLGDLGIFVIDTSSLRLRETLATTQPLTSLTLGADGRHLYATSEDRDTPLLQVNAGDGRWAAISGMHGTLAALHALP